jgi:Fe-S-cluster containining protein
MAAMTKRDPSSDVEGPCRRHSCTACCHDTEMTLTEADVARLEASGATDFMRVDHRGDLVLVNRSGRCVFLGDRGCRVYFIRPEGCRLYPLIFDARSGRVVRDGFCPFADEFPISAADARAVRRSVEREETEAILRLQVHRG